MVLGYDYWVSRFARDRALSARRSSSTTPHGDRGVSAAGFDGIDPATSPQIRVPIQMKPAMVPDWTWGVHGQRRSRWVQVFGRLKPGYTVESARAAAPGALHADRAYEMTLPPRRSGPRTRASSS